MSDLGRALLDALDADDLAELRRRLGLSERSTAVGRPTPEPLMTVEQAARRASTHPETIRRAVRDGRLPAGRVGRSLRIAPDALSAWLSGPHGAPQQPSRSPRPTRPWPGRRPMANALAQLESDRSA